MHRRIWKSTGVFSHTLPLPPEVEADQAQSTVSGAHTPCSAPFLNPGVWIHRHKGAGTAALSPISTQDDKAVVKSHSSLLSLFCPGMGSHSLVYDTFCSSQRTRGVTLCCPCKCLSSTQQGWPITDSPVLSLLILFPMFSSPPSSSLPLPYSMQPPFPFLSQVQLTAPSILSQVLSSFVTCTFPHLKQLKTSPRTHL